MTAVAYRPWLDGYTLPDEEIVALALGGPTAAAEAIETALTAGEDLHAIAIGRFCIKQQWHGNVSRTRALELALARLRPVIEALEAAWRAKQSSMKP